MEPEIELEEPMGDSSESGGESETKELYDDKDPVCEVEIKLLPEKSRKKYEAVYKDFLEWQKGKDLNNSFAEKVLLVYFGELAGKYKASSLWSRFSMLRSTLKINHGIPIERYGKLRSFLKRHSKGYQAKSARPFTPEQINKFINEAPDDKYLVTKVALIMSLTGSCHVRDLHGMKIQHVQDLGSAFLVVVPNSSTKTIRKFTITGLFYQICKQYAELRPPHTITNSFFVNYNEGKCTIQNIGINKFGSMGKQVARFLRLANPNDYTGHSFRRSSANVVVDADGDATVFKKDSGWKTTTTMTSLPEDITDYNWIPTPEPVKNEMDNDITLPMIGTMVNFTFRGLMAPVFTPFHKDLKLNTAVIPEYAKFLSNAGIKGVLVNGTSGEGPSLSVQERKTAAEAWSKACQKNNQHLMVQVGGAPLPDVLELANHAESIGAHSILCLPELYFKPSNPRQLTAYLKKVGEAAPNTPLLYYHIPAFSNVTINMGEFLHYVVGRIPTFQGIKFTSNALDEGMAAIRANHGLYAVFLGADTLMAGAYTLGFDSAIATSLNIFPQVGVRILENVQNSELETARKYQTYLTEICAVITKNGTWVPTMKAAMNAFTTIDVGQARDPLINLTPEQVSEMKSVVKVLKI